MANLLFSKRRRRPRGPSPCSGTLHRKTENISNGNETIISKPSIQIMKLSNLQLQYPEVNVDEEVRSRTKQLDGLKTALRTSTHSFVIRFMELDGLPALLDFLERMDYFTAQSSIHTSIIGCVKALMNNSVRQLATRESYNL